MLWKCKNLLNVNVETETAPDTHDKSKCFFITLYEVPQCTLNYIIGEEKKKLLNL